MLKLDKLTVTFGQNRFEFSLEAQRDKVIAVLGRSGSGKSTLLNLIAGFIKPESGNITWQSESLLSLTANQRPVTTLFQNHNLFSHLSVEQNIGLGIQPDLKLSEDDQQQLQQVLEEVGLPGFAKKKAGMLSGGEQQRVALARCLLRQQPILLLDEPYSALDEATRLDMIALTNRVIDEHNLCVILVTHQTEDAKRMNAKTFRLIDGMLTDV